MYRGGPKEHPNGHLDPANAFYTFLDTYHKLAYTLHMLLKTPHM